MDNYKWFEKANNMAETKGSFVTAKFGDNWKDNAHLAGFYSYDDLCHMAWVQGRRAIIFELALKEQFLIIEKLKQDLDYYIHLSRIYSNQLADMLPSTMSPSTLKEDLCAERSYDQIMNEKQIKKESEY